MIFPACPKKYIRDEKGAGFQLNAVPIENIIFFGNRFRLYFPRPFLLVGLVTIDDVPTVTTTSPSWLSSYSNPVTPAINAANSNLFPCLFNDLAFASCEDSSITTKPVNYIGPGEQDIDYRGYFSKFLNDAAINTERAQWYNSFIQPESVVKKFFDINAATAADVYLSRYYDLIEYLKRTTDLDMWGAPGEYNIRNTSQNFTIQWQPEQAYEFILDL